MVAPRKVIKEQIEDKPKQATSILDILCSDKLAEAEKVLVEEGILNPDDTDK